MLLRIVCILSTMFTLVFFTAGSMGCAGPVDDVTAQSTVFPETCAEIQEIAIEETGDRPENGTYTLYINGDESQPWDVYCHNMTRSEPLEYLTVTESANYSQIGNETAVATTSYRRYRIDPITLIIDPMDSTFADNDAGFDSFSPIFPVEGMEYIPAGWAEFQPTIYNMSEGVMAEVSLEGTAFIFSESIEANNLEDFFCKVTSDNSYDDDGTEATVLSDLTGFSLTAKHSYSFGPTPTSTRMVADCENLGTTATDFSTAAWPLEYVGQ
jgi:hypothetical protein